MAFRTRPAWPSSMFCVVLLVSFGLLPRTAHAQEVKNLSNAELLALVSQLQLRVQQLEGRVYRLEQELAVRRPPAAARVDPNEKWRSRELWDRLEKGMTRQQIDNLLGEPHTIREGAYEVWVYDRLSSGSLTFHNDVLYTWRRPR